MWKPKFALLFRCITLSVYPNNQALGRRSYLKRQRAALPPPAPTPIPRASSATIPDVFLYSFRGSRLNIAALSDPSEPATITEVVSTECDTCTVGTATPPGFTDLCMELQSQEEMENGIFSYWLIRLPNTMSRLIPCETPVALLQECITFIGKPIRFLRVDNAKKSTCPARVDFCYTHNIILQVFVRNNHLHDASTCGGRHRHL